MAIAVVGNVFVDIKGFPEGAYIPAGRNAGHVETVHGGVGRNVAEDIANMELRPRFVSMVDNTAEGMEVINKLKRHRIDTRYVIPTEDGMGIWLAIFDSTGDIAASISKRPKMEALIKLIEEKGDEIFADVDSIVIEIDMDKEIVKRIFGYAQKYNKSIYAVVANMSIATERRDFLRRVDCFVCNEQEAEILFAEDFSHLDRGELCDALSGKLEEADFNSIVVTMGSQGAVYAARNGDKGCVEAMKVAVKDTTGAGDAFFAGVAVGLTYGKPLADAVRIGTRLASAVITSSENVCPRFQSTEFGIEAAGADNE